MKTLASFLILSMATHVAIAEETLTDENFLGIWKTVEIGTSKQNNRAIVVLPDRLIDVTNVNGVKPVIIAELDSSTVSFVDTLEPPTIATNGRAGLSKALASAFNSALNNGPAHATGANSATP